MHKDFIPTLLTNTPSATAVNQAISAKTETGLATLNIDVGSMVSWLNYFTLSWCIFYTIILVADFFFWRVLYSNLEIPRIKRGQKSLVDAAKIWASYAVLTLFYAFYSLIYEQQIAQFLGVAVLLGYVWKLISDIPMIPVLGGKVSSFTANLSKAIKKSAPAPAKK